MRSAYLDNLLLLLIFLTTVISRLSAPKTAYFANFANQNPKKLVNPYKTAFSVSNQPSLTFAYFSYQSNTMTFCAKNRLLQLLCLPNS